MRRMQRMGSRRTFLGFVAVLVVCVSSMAWGEIAIHPVQPRVSDSVSVVVRGAFSSTCWSVGSVTCAAGAPDTLWVTVEVDYCSCYCATVIVPYERACSFGPLPEGSYVVMVTERHVIDSDPIPTWTRSLAFSVTGISPTVTRSWGSLKSIYR